MAIVLGDQAVGATVPLRFNGVATDFMVVHQGIPSSMYDSSCEGTWLLTKDVYNSRYWDDTNTNDYANSPINNYINSTILNQFDPEVKGIIKTVKIPYRPGRGTGSRVNSGANGLACKIFLLSGYEVGYTDSGGLGFPQDGVKLTYFDPGDTGRNKRIGNNYNSGSATSWWLRSPNADSEVSAWYITELGYCSSRNCSGSYGVRPALIMPSDARLSENGTITHRGVYIKTNGQWNLAYQSN